MRYEYYDIKPRLNGGIEAYRSGKSLMEALEVCVKDTYNMYSAQPIDEDDVWSGFDVMSDISDSCGKIQKRVSEDSAYRSSVYMYIMDAFLDRVNVDSGDDFRSVIGIV